MNKNDILDTIYFEDTDKLHELISKRVDFNFSLNDITPLYIACQEGFFEITKLLVANNADVNFCCDDKTSPLYGAAMNGHSKIVEFLLEKGADPNLARYDGKTPLFVASAQEENIEVVKLLIQKNAHVDSCDDDFNTPLYIAVQEEIYENVELLLLNNANVNHHGAYGITPIIKAIHKNNHEIVELLLNYGANLNAKYGAAESAYDAATKNINISNEITTLVVDNKQRSWSSDEKYLSSQKYLIDQIMFAIKINYYRYLRLSDCFEFNFLYAQSLTLEAVNFTRLESLATRHHLNYHEDEINFHIENICVPLKKANLFDAAHKVYKSIFAYYGVSTTLFKSWGKLLACAGQIDMAKKMFRLGKIIEIRFDNASSGQCSYHLNQIEESIKSNNLANYISAIMGDNKFIYKKIDLD